MKTMKMTLAALALTSLSFAGFAADSVNQEPMNQQQVGVVSATGSNLSSLESQLATKADAAGAKSFRITSTTGNNRMHATAEIYQ
ncbi:YdgH/BhsA/McbA-like domain containing protein [Erwinia sp. MMLR14_017]|uniref:multiple stress resistance protein BhsA n=1 Tax=Erwinia sp. MMLR14_017 TaxID=3093842 RepID=UPI00298F4A6A|nr:YdgH/BhsA/McbA-like domain containing protein [Erwinia sp. MMLR14_017]MDW8848273.1 YdgH/BhsA/McbA-like domain containing protein [Erwinia sp. MMLR14_017]